MQESIGRKKKTKASRITSVQHDVPSLSLTSFLPPSYHFFSACASAFLQIFSLTISVKVIPSSPHCMLLVAQPICGLYPSLALHNYMLSCLQFHALEPLYFYAWWLLRELILILVRTVSEWVRRAIREKGRLADSPLLLERIRELQEEATPET